MQPRRIATTTPLDAALATVFVIGAAWETVAATDDEVALRVALGVAAPIGLLWRRTHPTSSVLVIAAALATESLATESPDQMFVLLAIVISAYSVAAEATHREALLGLALLSASIAISISVDPSDSVSNIPPTLALFLALPAGLGLAFRRRGRTVAALELRNEALHREAETAVEDERRRIARELHDVVSHAVTLIAVQAEAGRSVVRSDAEAAERALAAIGATSRDALAELHTLVALLRDPADLDPAQPRGLARLPALVSGARSAGLDVSVETTGDPGSLDTDIDQASFRVVQEALTNALRHSQDPRVTIRVEHDATGLLLRVDSTGPAHQSSYGGTGTGLAGLRERVVALGGTFEAGATEPDLYTVDVWLPEVPR